MTDASLVRYEFDDPIATITIDRPDKMNALTLPMRQRIPELIHDADAMDEVRAIIITGAGDAFCSGMDLDAVDDEAFRESIDPDAVDDLTLRSHPVTTPIISAVTGPCIAAGFELLLATDLRIAGESARFGLLEPRWGLIPAAGSHVRLPRQLPHCKAMEFLLTGSLFSADHALDCGLVNDVVPDDEVGERANDLANTIAKNSPIAIRRSKEIVNRTRDHPTDIGFQLEAKIGNEVLHGEDAKEGMRAHEEGREPSFRM